jgi:hypothetical protein
MRNAGFSRSFRWLQPVALKLLSNDMQYFTYLKQITPIPDKSGGTAG